MVLIYVEIGEDDSPKVVDKKIIKKIPLGYEFGNVQRTWYIPEKLNYMWEIEILRSNYVRL